MPAVQAILPPNSFDRSVKGIYKPYGPVPLAQNAVVDIYNQANGDKPLAWLHIQNIGTNEVFLQINDAVAANYFCKILAADTGANKGLGGSITIPMDGDIRRVSAIVTDAAGSTVSVILITNPSNTRV